MADRDEYTENSTIARGRSALYSLLAAVFQKEATGELLDAFGSEKVRGALMAAGVNLEPIINKEDRKALLEALAEEYAALFVLPGGVSPYASARLKGLLCQEPEAEARAFYRRCGLEMKDDSKIFSDHLGLELAFMGALAAREAEAWQGGREDEALKWKALEGEFFRGHLETWVFKFLDDLDELAFHPFYREISKLTRRFLETEQGEPGSDETRTATV